MAKEVWVELDEHGRAIRIFRSPKFARELPTDRTAVWTKAEAVRCIREQVYQRSKEKSGFSECEWCSRSLTRKTGQMHEALAKGKRDADGNYGEVSVANSVFICHDCHQGKNGAHGNRRWHSAKLKGQ